LGDGYPEIGLAKGQTIVKNTRMENIVMILSISLLTLVEPMCTLKPARHEKRILFFGDSITELGIKPNGYITLLQKQLKPEYPALELIGAGISGHKVPDLLARLQRDVLDRQPTTVVIYIGVNDVWHSVLPGHYGTPRDEYRDGLIRIIRSIKSIGARVILCTPSVIGEKPDGSNPLDPLLEEYAQISRNVAAAENIKLCDLRRAFIDYLKANNPEMLSEGILTYDGVHLSDAGNRFVADRMLEVLESD